MERPRQDDPVRIGPYLVLGAFDPETARAAVPERRYLARSASGDDTVLLAVPRADADPDRWWAEAENARRHTAPGLLGVTWTGRDGRLPWRAAPYVPALALPAALDAHGGPLPGPAVRSLGAALARTLATLHDQGVTHAGLSPSAVLITAEGVRLTAFGAVRAAAPDGERRWGLPGLEPGSLAPEQASGGRPRPPGDLYGLGAVLAYASTGHTVPENAELPPSLRNLIAGCLARDPAGRPAAHQVHAALASPGSSGSPTSPVPTVLDTAGHPTPLPARVVVALARQAAQVLAAEAATPSATDGFAAAVTTTAPAPPATALD
ncbi:serine/threonine protein kinase [Streptomyces sp. NPDC045431]|uniref:serine/threonine protein kinase n=1 Tax=Streptomyces sp. NPDC045431 TaxID=3155613 RepID=UPI0033D9EC71